MRTNQIVVSMAVAAFALLGLAGTASAASGGAYASDNISIYELPRARANEIVGMLQAGEQVAIDRCTPSQKWCRVFHDGRTGWVPGSYLIGAATKNNETPLPSLTSPGFH
ncbi:MAG TPA: SH3 domain-containing protein [Devosiaceae bacterium]|nr:SH3 domain-containing protein [Devosiaceae bacterium]